MNLRWHHGWIAILVLLLVFLVISAGCTSIPGPESRTTPAPAKTTVPVTPQVKTPVDRVTPQSAPATAAIRTLAPATPTRSPQGTYESRTCAQQGGGIAKPGQQCPGAWLTATDTFSCCSVPPVREPVLNTSVMVNPFDISITLDDDPGTILP